MISSSESDQQESPTPSTSMSSVTSLAMPPIPDDAIRLHELEAAFKVSLIFLFFSSFTPSGSGGLFQTLEH
jgi:hypothetical protein